MAALFGFAALISPPFRPQFLSATTVLSDLFLETLAFFCLHCLSIRPGYQNCRNKMACACFKILSASALIS
jgi:hypothetical protein